MVRLTGLWRVNPDNDGRWRYQLHDAQRDKPAGWAAVGRRGVVSGGALFCLAGCAPAADVQTAAKVALGSSLTVDVHTHAGGVASVRRVETGQGFASVAPKMRAGGMNAICLAIVSDGPVHHVEADGHIHPYRDPAPGELYQYGQRAFARLHEMARDQSMTIIRDRANLHLARTTPSVIVTAEGADFLEGQIDRVDEAFARWSLRHLQLTHYRVNELGDIQTEAPVHGGLTDFGVQVIRRCQNLGIVVDVAHGTFDLVKRAVSVTTKPLVLSHTSLTHNPGPFSRQITPEHARMIAGTGGVIGVWPPASIYGSLMAMATGMARLADVVGVDHVGLGSDMRGLVGASIFPDYDQLPSLAEALIGAGFSGSETSKLLGGNYARVFEACVA